ncbi:hypothetical protein [Bradyrhizobium sp. AZCC 2289]|uniref:hypothetical protein n=1 Tax=Bradyrhizobium sp. AZCC 2289 TaxID=3117026 RepID=UPI002FF3EE22
MVGAALIGWYFHAELAAYVTRYSGELNNVRIGTDGVEVVEQKTPVPIQDAQKADSLARDPALPQQAGRVSSQAPRDTAQDKQGAEVTRPEAQQPLDKERRRADAPANEQTAQLSQAAETATAELRQALQKERDRAEALAGELAKARRDIETQLALPSKARDQAAQRNQAAEKATAELRQSLKTEHDRAEALTGELAKARRDLETQLALSSKAGDEAVQVKKAAESATAELRQSLQKERDRAEALTSELAKAKRDTETQLALSSKAGEAAVQEKKAAESATAELRQSLQKEHDRAEALTGELAKARRDLETQLAPSSKAGQEAAQVKKAAESATAELRQSLQKERDRAEALTSELAKAKREIETQVALSSKAGEAAVQEKKAAESATAELRQSLQKEHDRAEALTSELARARRDLETQLALSSKAGEEAAQVKKAADSATAELRQSLQKEHDRAEALTGELARARRDLETQLAPSSKAGQEAAQVKKAAENATAELRQSLQKEHDRAEALTSELAKAKRDIETQLALSSKAGEEAAQVKKAAESATAELRLSLQKERDRAEALAPGRESMQSTIGARSAVERASNSQISQVPQAAEAAVTEQPAATEAQGSPEVARLLARASALLGQGNIGAARTVLERAVETGSAQASFMLAETYDPLVLSTWKTFGTRGDVTKARELYAKALAGGIQEAKDRSVALR